MEFCVEIIANGGIMATCIPLIKLINIQLFILCSYEPDLVLPCSLDSRVTLDWCLLQTRPPQRTFGISLFCFHLIHTKVIMDP